MVNVYVLSQLIVVVIITNVLMVIWKNKYVHYINSIRSKQNVVKIFKLLIVVPDKNVSILVSIFPSLWFMLEWFSSGDYDNSPLCEFKPVCRDKPNGNYVDKYRPNCQFHYTCLESRTFNYTACEHGHRFSVQHQKCLPAKQVRCQGRRRTDPCALFNHLVLILISYFLSISFSLQE